MNLKKFIAQGFLIESKTDKNEVAKLLRLAERDIREATKNCHETDWQFAIAYNAALQLASIA